MTLTDSSFIFSFQTKLIWYVCFIPIIYIYTVWFQFLYRINAAFGVSNKFVPYRPNWDLVCDNLDFYTPIIKRAINTNLISSYTLISACTLTLKPAKDDSGTTIAAPVYRITGFVGNGTVGVRGIILSRSNDASDFDTLANMYCKAKQDSAGFSSLVCNTVTFNNDTSSPTAYKSVYCWAKGAATGTGRVYTIAERLG